jgi:hypothetical protein
MAYNLACDWRAGFVMDPQKKQRCGYLLALDGFGLSGPLPQDITVFLPYNATPAMFTDKSLLNITAESTPASVQCVGVLDSFSWGGGVGDPISLSVYLSTENAQQIKTKLQTTLTTTSIKKLSWWIANYDEVNKVWFEEAYPLGKASGSKFLISGQLNAPGGKDVRLHVADEAVKVAPNIDVNVIEVSFEIVPAANETYDLGFALDEKQKYVNGWGLKVGAQPLTAIPTVL